MIFTTPMKLLVAVVLDEASDDVSKELLRKGVLHMVSIQELSGEWKNRVEPIPANVSLARIGEIRKRLEGFFQAADPPMSVPGPSLDNIVALDLDAADRNLDELGAELNGIRDRQRKIQDEILKTREIHRQVSLMEDLGGHAQHKSAYSFLAVRTGTLSSDGLSVLDQSLENMPSVLISSGLPGLPASTVLLITLRRDDSRILPLLTEVGWQDLKIPEETKGTKEAVERELDSRIDALVTRQKETGAEANALFSGRADELTRLWSSLRVEELLIRMRARFSRTQSTVLFSGWIPQERVSDVESLIQKSTKGLCYLEWLSPDHEEAKSLDVPVALRSPKALLPFEKLVKNYAVPEYGGINPTPFVAAAYLAMFGLMFGDVGHGLVLVVLGALATLSARRKGKPDWLYRLILYCGCSAAIAGVLFGSYFGHPWLPPLWFDYHGAVSGHGGGARDVYDILGITIKFGMIVLGTGLVLNWVNLIRKRKWVTLALDRAGLLGGWIYGAGAWAAFYFVGHNYKALPPMDILLWILGVPTLLLGLKAPLEYLHTPKERRKPFGGMVLLNFLLEWIVEILETFSGYLANTLSFMRVAGLGIAHVSLMTAFFQIARMISPDGSISVASEVIIIVGNVLVIALEGLSAGIQSLRLNYYEFFSKYFNGTGRAYNPVSLH